ncbi:putative TonB-dependent receptor [gamma proteobacterium NOR5-3]|nr:putative TonB-dependent receptor [gamma proteobacterium NOR5-3]
MLGDFSILTVLVHEQLSRAASLVLALAIIASVSMCFVQAASATAQGQYRLSLPAQSMDRSLSALAAAVGAQTLFSYEEMNDLMAPALDGDFTVTEALRLMLEGTAYQGRLTDKGVIVIRQVRVTKLPQEGNKQMGNNDNNRETGSRTGGYLLSALAAFFSADGIAQVAPSEGGRSIEEIIVTATRRDSGIQSTAMSVNALTGEQLDNNVYSAVEQVLDSVPGVTFAVQGPSVNRIIIRNISTSTDQPGGETVAAYFNDFPLSAGRGTSPALRLVDMDRVEVLKGPQGTLFGRSAMGGIVRYLANKPSTDSLSGGINGYVSDTTDGGGNFGGYGYLNVPITDTLALRGVVYNYDHEGFIENIELGSSEGGSEDTTGGRLALRWEPTERLSAELTYLNQRIRSGNNWSTDLRTPPNDPAGAITPASAKARAAIGGIEQRNNVDYEAINIDLQYDFDAFSATFLGTRISEENWRISEQREFVGITNGCVCDGNVAPTKLSTDSDVLELRLVSAGDGRLDWIAGAYYEKQDQDSVQNITYFGSGDAVFGFFPVADGDLAIDSVQDLVGEETAVYAELGWSFTDATRLVAGYRRADVEYGTIFTKTDGFFLAFNGTAAIKDVLFDTQEDVNTYKFSLEHAFSDDMFTYITAASGYRRGGFNVPTPLSEFSTFDSDSLWSYEVGLKSTLMNGRLVANVAAFFIDWTDIQLPVQDPVTFIVETKNVGGAEIPGVEFSLSALLTENLDVTFAGSLTRPELTEDVPGGVSGKKGDTLPGAAEENFSIVANYRRALASGFEVFGAMNYRYVGERLNDFNTDLDVALPSYDLLDVNLGLASSAGYSVSLFAHNVFDEAVTYDVDNQGASFKSIRTNRPRTLGVNLTYDF